ncbi:ABC transporter ATP-binding protein [Pontibacter mangrovi]|uniref:ABC transporter ATP-binding protein n=1 Tax=Pontibacter mangrovi TaxID=2589816 RepID=A0A501W5N5_9BACT|nr:ABC transporter ATP-binding protein [Pontibacter mangrovi]TPE43394.1 ABC transporter ATP-binding protein [Pontibacter mangrovi]
MGADLKERYAQALADPPVAPPATSLSSLVLGLVKPYWTWLAIIFLAMLAETGMSLATPWPLKVIIDNVIGNEPLPHWLLWVEDLPLGRHNMELAAVAASAMVLFNALGGLASYTNNYFTESVAQYVANDLRRRMYHHLLRLSLSYYDTHQVGKLLSTITSDVSTIQDFASETLLNILIDALTIIGILSLMFYLNWDFTLMAVSVSPFILLFIIRFKKAVKAATHEVRKDQAEMVAVLQQGLESIRAINAYGRQDLEEDRLKQVSLETVEAALRARKIKSIVSPVVTILVSFCTAFVLWRGASLVLAGVMTIGALTVFLSYLSKFFSPIKDLAKMTTNIAQAMVALERIQQILETDIIIHQKPNARNPGKLKGNIVFENVTFSYADNLPVLHNISLLIQAGQHVGICGPTGSGKSTIASLIPRFYDPDAGRILIDGTDVRDFTLEGLRMQIGFVLQETVLIYGSIQENIAYGRPEATAAEIIEAAKRANAHDFICRFPKGYHTLVGERGMTLSGGERQRIGIARAIVRNSPILILDEPTASLDTEAERSVLEALENLMRGRTVITITHRLRTICHADKIFVIREGVVAEEGTHEELLQAGKLYSELYQLQDRKAVTINGSPHDTRVKP